MINHFHDNALFLIHYELYHVHLFLFIPIILFVLWGIGSSTFLMVSEKKKAGWLNGTLTVGLFHFEEILYGLC